MLVYTTLCISLSHTTVLGVLKEYMSYKSARVINALGMHSEEEISPRKRDFIKESTRLGALASGSHY